MQERGEWSEIFKVMKEKYYILGILNPLKHFKTGGFRLTQMNKSEGLHL